MLTYITAFVAVIVACLYVDYSKMKLISSGTGPGQRNVLINVGEKLSGSIVL